jgi:hypothetical protein
MFAGCSRVVLGGGVKVEVSEAIGDGNAGVEEGGVYISATDLFRAPASNNPIRVNFLCRSAPPTTRPCWC